MVKAFHREQFPLDGIMSLIQQGAGCRHLRVFEHRIPTCFFLSNPAPDALAVRRSRRGGNVSDKAAEPLTQRKHPQALALARAVEQGVELGPNIARLSFGATAGVSPCKRLYR